MSCRPGEAWITSDRPPRTMASSNHATVIPTNSSPETTFPIASQTMAPSKHKQAVANRICERRISFPVPIMMQYCIASPDACLRLFCRCAKFRSLNSHLFPVRRLSKLHPYERSVNAPQQPRQYAACTNLDEPRHTVPSEQADGIRPLHGIRHLLIQPLPSLRSTMNLSRLPVVHQRDLQIAKRRRIQIDLQLILRRFHQGTMKRSADRQNDRSL